MFERERELCCVVDRYSITIPTLRQAARVAAAELKKLRRMSEQQPGYSSLREYLEWIADLPWAKESSAPPIADDAEAATVVTLSGGAFPTPPSTYLGLESRSSRRFSQLTSSKLR